VKTALTLNESRAEERRQNLRAAFRKGLSSVPNRGPGLPKLSVSVQGYQYLVDVGEKENLRYHRVSKDKTCSCGDPFCDAIDAVRQYLQAGGTARLNLLIRLPVRFVVAKPSGIPDGMASIPEHLAGVV
jgi:hypothetical protein